MVSGPELIIACLAVCLLALVLIRRLRAGRRLVAEVVVLLLLAGLLAASGAQPLPAAAALAHGELLWIRVLRVAWWVAAARAAATALDLMLGLRDRSRQARLLNDLLTTALYVAVALVVLNSVLGLRVGALIATSGLVAVVIGLALQTTLADLFSGVAVGLEQPFHIGDRVELADGVVEGEVVFMSWRSVRVLTDGNDVVTVPNSLVAKSHILNRTARSEVRGLQMEVTARAHWPAPQVIARLHEAALLTPGVLETPGPEVVMTRLGQRLNGYAILFRVASSRMVQDVRSRLLIQVQRQVRLAGLNEDAAPDARALLKAIVLFEALDDDQLEAVTAAVATTTVPAGEDLFRQGEVGTCVYFLARGVLEIRRADMDGAVHVLGRIGAGEYIGEIGMLTGEPRPITAHAFTPVTVLELTRELLQTLIAQHPALGPLMQESVERGLRLLERDAAALHPTPDRTDTSLLARIRSFFAPAKP